MDPDFNYVRYIKNSRKTNWIIFCVRNMVSFSFEKQKYIFPEGIHKVVWKYKYRVKYNLYGNSNIEKKIQIKEFLRLNRGMITPIKNHPVYSIRIVVSFHIHRPNFKTNNKVLYMCVLQARIHWYNIIKLLNVHSNSLR